MTEYLKDIRPLDKWTLELAIAELVTDGEGASDMLWVESEQYCVFDLLSLGKGKMQEGLDSAFGAIRFKRKYLQESSVETEVIPQELPEDRGEEIIFDREYSPQIH